MNQKLSNRKLLKNNHKSMRFSGYAKAKVGTPLNIHDRSGNELCVGDLISYDGVKARILYIGSLNEYAALLCYSQWYGDNVYDSRSYGKKYPLPLDNGARMSIVKLEEA